jgi:hypothetical protein
MLLVVLLAHAPSYSVRIPNWAMCICALNAIVGHSVLVPFLPNHSVELQSFLIRTLMICTNVFIYNPKWQSAVQLILACQLTFVIWYWQPQIEGVYMSSAVMQLICTCTLLALMCMSALHMVAVLGNPLFACWLSCQESPN